MEKILPWFTLKTVPGIGNHLIKRLICRFKSPESVLEASGADLTQIEGLSPRLARAIRQHRLPEACEKELEATLKGGYKIVTLLDPAYPGLLAEIPDPPPFLYVSGNLDPAAVNMAVVGSRNATAYGISSARRLCADLAGLGITVVSGMARGIDTAAHEGALTGKGKTIAVLGSGLERIYPRENKRLFHQIAQNGAVVSEFSLWTEPEPHNFPVRNRIISGMSLGTVVVEASQKSGSLITARLAAEQGREVFAIPGSIRSFKSTGTHHLIKQGAKLVEDTRDILEELSHAIHPVGRRTESAPPGADAGPGGSLTAEELKVVRALGPYPTHIDTLVQKTGLLAGKLSGLLLQLELKGRVHQSPGKFFILNSEE